ncbi:hypothetical protein ATCC19606_09230 [Acinetobacter baumannii]|uniref:Uncharacterized protein n=1 Tax=Acinetobacter baumannii TaxID=470 RepID=A0A6F8TC85_ACIBA|nr:hypothetical protein ATCC19606_09230 [Acinetobacter baumannii]
MKKTFDLYQTAQVLLASTSFLLGMSTHAYTWKLDDISTSTKYTVEPHFSILEKVLNGKTFSFRVTTQLKMTQQYSSNMTISSFITLRLMVMANSNLIFLPARAVFTV